MRKTRLILILTLLCILIAAPAWAVPNESALKQQSSADISPTSMTMLMNGSAYIADTGNSSLFIECATYAYYAIDKIGLEIDLQRWNGSSWTTIDTFKYANYNSSEISKSLGVPALSGYSYRLVTKHYCQHGLEYEYLYTTTSGVTVY